MNGLSVEGLKFSDRDEFKRERIADSLISLLDKDMDRVSPLVIDGEWGCGKTEFCHKMINKIGDDKTKQWRSVYINAFKFDHIDDPFSMLVSQIMSTLADDGKRKIGKKAIPILKVIGKTGISWLLRQNADAVGKEFTKAISETGDSLIGGYLEDFGKIEQSIESFKEALEEEAKKEKIIVFVDELDRCRPSFALGIIEKIKHIFDVENVGFVFFANLDQMEAMVKSEYGSGIDAGTYLSKFFEFTVKLPEYHRQPSGDRHYNAFNLFAKEVDNNTAGFFRENCLLEDLFRLLFENDSLSLRDAKQMSAKILIYYSIAPHKFSHSKNEDILYHVFWLVGVYIYIFKKEFADKILQETAVPEDINRLFKIEKMEDYKKFQKNIKEWFAVFYLSSVSDEALQIHKQGYRDGQGTHLCREAWQNLKYIDKEPTYREGLDIVREYLENFSYFG